MILLSVEEEDQQIVRLILTLLYYAGKGDNEFGKDLSACPLSLERLMCLRAGDISRLLDPLVSLLTIPVNPNDTIEMLHASFFDYFQTPQRSGVLGLLPIKVAHAKIAVANFPVST